MKRTFLGIIAMVLFLSFGTAFAVDIEIELQPITTEKEKGLIDWTQNYIEATGMAVAPKGTKGAQAKALARRGATVDLQRNLLEFLAGVQVDARTTMDDFMAEDRVRSEVHGMIKNVELLKGEWDGEAYTVTGRIKLAEVRSIVCPRIPVDKVIIETERKSPPPKSSGKFTGLVIDVRHLPLIPAMTFRVFDESGRAVYGVEFANQEALLRSGICSYYNNINYAHGELRVAPSPIKTKAIRLSTGNVDIIIPNSAAVKIRGSSYDFRKECKVLLVVK